MNIGKGFLNVEQKALVIKEKEKIYWTTAMSTSMCEKILLMEWKS